ncbi:unnamed protein product [Adineta ricciae]|uniref:ADP ribosyltransferase domain-containing protein n=2 Tax=Adineta ricciae TaxID=249248 RepID=A0A813P0B5_ADIRI|nr:unnamed protein product [Adineta ricciae]
MSENLETYSLIWLDNAVNQSFENLQAQQVLRKLIHHLLIFEDVELCLDYIDHLSSNDRVLLIVNGRLGQIIVPQVVLLRQIVSIYVYCIDKQTNEKWTRNFTKVKGVFVQLNDLIEQIRTDQLHRQQYQRIDESLTINVFKLVNSNEGQSTTGSNGQFIHFHLLIDCLIRMDTTMEDKEELLMYCKHYYKDNPTELNIIDEFKRTYSSNRAIWWFTRECFLYRLINKALRVQNIDLLYLLRFVIADIDRQLMCYRCSTPVRVYRAQQMSRDEIEILKNSIGQLISMNSFLSTTLSRQYAQRFLHPLDENSDVERVFFEIDANPQADRMKAFSQINSLSYFPLEDEVLFMIGSIFRLDHIHCDSEGIWNIRMVLCADDDHHLQTLFQHMKNEFNYERTDTLIFGHLLRKMGKLDDAEKYYQRALDRFSFHDSNMALCYHALGLVADDKGDYQASLTWYNKSLEIFLQILEPDDSNLALLYNSIAIIHQQTNNYHLALESYEKALMIWRQAVGEDHPHVAICLNNISNVYRHEKKYQQALDCVEKALIILKKYLPDNHADLASSYGSSGNIHFCLEHYDQALQYYHQSLTIYRKCLPCQHPDIAMTLNNIGNVYESNDEHERALDYYKQAGNIYRDLLPVTHPNVIQIEQSIQRVSTKLKC